ncbi:MAG TPA: acyl-CoA dehydrogenase family protein [Rhodocyclaceae bacterium]|nr:acyl-CoA dehydrogenase family protein [Rhodocyclaceae bacterium]
MDFIFSDEQQAIREAVLKTCARFGDDYWTQRDREGGFPEELYQALAQDGWLGIAMPKEFGGSGLGITEGAILVQAVNESGAGLSGGSAIGGNIFAPNVVVVYGTDEQKQRILPSLIRGEVRSAFAVTEPNTGLDTLKLRTRAVRDGDRYILNGRKVWISTAQVSQKMLILARTTPIDQVKRATDGLSLFYTDIDRRYVTVREIEKMGRKAVDSNELFIDNLPIPAGDRIGEEGRGFHCILHGLNPERILIAAGLVGIGRAALKRAAAYAGQRVVFDRPIGMNQGVQHPLAECWMELEAANLVAFKAATLYDQGQPCGSCANPAKYLAAQAAVKACETAVLTHGGFGYAKEYQVERYLREVLIHWIAPISPQLVKCFIAEKELGLPKSY